MDIHHRAVAILHIVEAAFLMLMLISISLFFSVIAAFVKIEPAIIAILSGLGSIIILPFFLLAIGQIIAAVSLLRGNQNAKIWVMIFGGLSLFNFPFGTALGIYTFWALLREFPQNGSNQGSV